MNQDLTSSDRDKETARVEDMFLCVLLSLFIKVFGLHLPPSPACLPITDNRGRRDGEMEDGKKGRLKWELRGLERKGGSRMIESE